MTAVSQAIAEWSAAGEDVVVATVVETKKSAPQPAGTKMAIDRAGRVVGAVSGGCVEGAVVEVAETILAGGPPRLLHYGIADSDAWDVGLPCGGEITIWVEAFAADGLAGRFARRGRERGRSALVTALEGTGVAPGAKLLVDADGVAEGSLGADADADRPAPPAGATPTFPLDAEAEAIAREALWTEERGRHRLASGASVFVDVIAPPPRLLIFGAVDFAAELSAVAAMAGWRAFVIDPRARFATRERFPAAEEVIAAWPDRALTRLEPIDRATAVAVLTHDPKLDDAALLRALASDAPYIGAMGSRRAQERRRERLLAAGVEEPQLARISAPIGLDLGALTAAETALSIMGEIVALRHGRAGGRLIDARGRIHDASPA